MINRIVLVGHITKAPELRRTQNDTPVATFTVAVDNRTKGPDGERTSSFINVVAWDKLADTTYKYARKRSLVAVEGRLEQRKYARKDGSNAYVYEVIADSVRVLDPKNTNEESNEDVENTNNNEAPAEVDESKNIDFNDMVDEDIDF